MDSDAERIFANICRLAGQIGSVLRGHKLSTALTALEYAVACSIRANYIGVNEKDEVDKMAGHIKEMLLNMPEIEK